MSSKNTVATPSPKYDEQLEGWVLPKDLLGGTRAMRNAGQRWLPREEKEGYTRYTARLNRTILFNAFRDTVNKIAARPFAQPVTTDQDDKNVDNMGNDLTTFAGDVFKDALRYGRSHIFVNLPATTGITLADAKEPYLCMVSPINLIDWETGYSVEGSVKLTMVKFFEGSNSDRIRIIDETNWALHVKKGNDWILDSQGEHTFGGVPFATLQISHGFMTGEPPFEDLAWENLAHWQSSSDHRNILRYARIPMLYRVGFTEDELEKPVELGPASVLSSVNPDAKVGFVEHSGAAIAAGLNDLTMLEKHMETLGMQPIMRPTVEETATGRSIDNDRTMSDAQKWAKLLQGTLVEAYRMAGQWKNKIIEPSVTVFMDFNLTAGDAQLLTNAAAAELITQATWIKEMQRRGILDDTVDPKKEAPSTDVFAPSTKDPKIDPKTGKPFDKLASDD